MSVSDGCCSFKKVSGVYLRRLSLTVGQHAVRSVYIQN